MRKMVAMVALTALAGCGFMPKLNIGAAASAVIPEDGSLDNTYLIDVFARIDVSSVQVEASVGYSQYDYNDGVGTESDLTIIPVALVAKYSIGTSAANVVLGGGLVWNVTDINEIGAGTTTVDNAAFYRIVAGANLKLPAGFGLTTEAMFDFTKDDLGSVATGNIDTSGLKARVAFSYNF